MTCQTSLLRFASARSGPIAAARSGISAITNTVSARGRESAPKRKPHANSRLRSMPSSRSALPPALREVRSRYVNAEQPPASTLVGVSALVGADWLIEIEVVAVLPE